MKLDKTSPFEEWVDMDEETQFYVKNLTREQEQDLQDIMLNTNLSDTVAGAKGARFAIKCGIKNWRTKINDEWKEVLIDVNGEECPCVLKNDKLDDDLWWDLVKNADQAMNIFNKIKKQLGLDKEDDQKK